MNQAVQKVVRNWLMGKKTCHFLCWPFLDPRPPPHQPNAGNHNWNHPKNEDNWDNGEDDNVIGCVLTPAGSCIAKNRLFRCLGLCQVVRYGRVESINYIRQIHCLLFLIHVVDVILVQSG